VNVVFDFPGFNAEGVDPSFELPNAMAKDSMLITKKSNSLKVFILYSGLKSLQPMLFKENLFFGQPMATKRLIFFGSKK